MRAEARTEELLIKMIQDLKAFLCTTFLAIKRELVCVCVCVCVCMCVCVCVLLFMYSLFHAVKYANC